MRHSNHTHDNHPKRVLPAITPVMLILWQDPSPSGNEESPLMWFIGLAMTFLVILILLRYSIYTFLVKLKLWLPEKASKPANFVFWLGMLIGAIVLFVQALMLAN